MAEDIITRSVEAALACIEKYTPEEFQKLQGDPDKKEALLKAAREAAEEEMKLSELLSPLPSEPDIADILAKHLPQRRLELIRTGLQVQTYRLDIKQKSDGHYWVDITRDGKQFMKSKELNTVAAIDETNWIQMASIIVEAVMLVLQVVGIKVVVSEQVIAKTTEEVIPMIKSSSQLQKAIEALDRAAQSGSNMEMAKAIFHLIKDSYSAGILWNIIKSLCSNMTPWDWGKTAGIVTAMIIAALATDGVALIAKIVLALNSAYEFVKKLTNVDELKTLKKGL